MSYSFTTHDRPIWVDGLLCLPEQSVSGSAMQRVASLDPDSVELTGIQSWLPGNFMINNGLQNKEVTTVKGVDWRNPPTDDINAIGDTLRQTGIVGNVQLEGETTWKIDVQSKIKRLLNQSPVKTTSPLCSHRFTDSGCGLLPENHTFNTTIDEVIDQRTFTINSYLTFSYGTITFTDPNSGNAGLSFTVLNGDKVEGQLTKIILFEAPESLIVPGESITAMQGCAKTENYCRDQYNNFLQFNGIPMRGGWMPGNDFYSNPGKARID